MTSHNKKDDKTNWIYFANKKIQKFRETDSTAVCHAIRFLSKFDQIFVLHA